MANAILTVENIYKSYQQEEVLKGITFSLKQGEIVSLLGPSGSGKTTLFRLIAGLSKADSGTIKLAEKCRVAYVFQDPRLLPWKSVEGNLTFVQKNYLPTGEASRLREELLRLVGLKKYVNHYPGQLSGGMRQRLEFIRGLSIKPDLILMDEPFKSVDTALKIRLREVLLAYWSRHKFSLLLITHDPEEALMLADRIYLLSNKPSILKEEVVVDIKQEDRELSNPVVIKALTRIQNLLQEELIF